LGVRWLPKQLAAFHQRYPRLQVETLVDNRAVNLVRREADIALRLFRPEQSDLIAKKIGLLTMGMYGSKDYLAKHGYPKKVSDLKKHRHVGFDESLTQRADVQRLEQHFLPENIVHRSNSFTGHLEAASAGIGLAITDCCFADAYPNLERVLLRQMTHKMEVWLVTHAEIGRSARIRVLFDHIAESFHADRELFAGMAVAEDAA